MELEQLMDLKVTTVAKREQSFASAAAAIYTITQEDIRRSGATNLPEILQQAPSMEVARINPSMWAVTARGFNGQFANKLLVLIGGRSVYTPLFSGVYWDEQMPQLDDIQRIEIICGPGASLWGSNAVNGVINIITCDSEQTQGTRLVAGAGNEEKDFICSRYGFHNGNYTGHINAQLRQVDASKYHESQVTPNDDCQTARMGLHLDFRPSVSEKGTLDFCCTETNRKADIFIHEDLQALVNPHHSFDVHAWHSTANWLCELDNQDALFLQAYSDSDRRVEPLNVSIRLTLNFEAQRNRKDTARHRASEVY